MGLKLTSLLGAITSLYWHYSRRIGTAIHNWLSLCYICHKRLDVAYDYSLVPYVFVSLCDKCGTFVSLCDKCYTSAIHKDYRHIPLSECLFEQYS